jgi:hypothetical protein
MASLVVFWHFFIVVTEGKDKKSWKYSECVYEFHTILGTNRTCSSHSVCRLVFVMDTAVSFLPFCKYQGFKYYVEAFQALKERILHVGGSEISRNSGIICRIKLSHSRSAILPNIPRGHSLLSITSHGSSDSYRRGMWCRSQGNQRIVGEGSPGNYPSRVSTNTLLIFVINSALHALYVYSWRNNVPQVEAETVWQLWNFTVVLSA